MSDGIYVRVMYRDEICFEKKFRVISGDTIVLSVDDLVAEKIAVEREACEPKIYNDIDEMFRDMGVPVAWMHDSNVGFNVPLYTAPPQRECQGLTDEPIGWIYEDDEGRIMFTQVPQNSPFWEPVYKAKNA